MTNTRKHRILEKLAAAKAAPSQASINQTANELFRFRNSPLRRLINSSMEPPPGPTGGQRFARAIRESRRKRLSGKAWRPAKKQEASSNEYVKVTP